MKRNFIILSLMIACFIVGNVNGGEITPSLRSNMPTEGKSKVIIRMKEQIDARIISKSMPTNLKKAEKTEMLMKTMEAYSVSSQTDIISTMKSQELSSEISNIKQYWISNVIVCEASSYAIEQLASREDVEYIGIDVETQLDGATEATTESPKAATTIASHLNVVKALEANEYGYEGKDVIVAVIDTGINYNHKDLKDAMWTDPEFPNHGYDFRNGDIDPMDDNGHGTHCAGIIAGNGTAGTRTGVATKVKLMALKTSNAAGNMEQTDVWDAIEFAAKKKASIISFSGGWVAKANPDRVTWRSIMENLQDLNVLFVVAAGNEGGEMGTYPIPNNVRTPGDCPAAWLHPEQEGKGLTTGVFTVGATNVAGNQIITSSSKGPSTWKNVSDYSDYPYKPGTGLIKPDIAAPGENVLSCNYKNNSGYMALTGTSMATPCVAGIAALILSKNPELTPAEVVQCISESAVKLSPKFNTSSGAGCANALASVLYAKSNNFNCKQIAINETKGYKDGKINIGDEFALDLTFENKTDAAISNIAVKLSALTTNVNLSSSDNVLNIEKIEAKSTIELKNSFNITLNKGVKIGDIITFAIEATSGESKWANSFNFVVSGALLEFADIAISDEEGNGNGVIEKGETGTLVFAINNKGNNTAHNVTAILTTDSKYISITEDPKPSNTNIEREETFTSKIKVADEIPTLYYANMVLQLTGDNIDTLQKYRVNIGKTGVLIVDQTNDNISATRLAAGIQQKGDISYELTHNLPKELSNYESVWYLSGVYPNNSLISSSESQLLDEYLNTGGKLYLEGGNVWWSGTDISVISKFNINAKADDGGTIGIINGITGTFTADKAFAYTMNFRSIDKLEAIAPAYAILENADPKFTTTIAYENDTYKTIGSSIEIGGLLAENNSIIDDYFKFFDIKVIPVGVNNLNASDETQIIIYPNPSTGEFAIRGEFESYEVVNMQGKTIFTSNTTQTPRLTPGIYLIKVKADNTIITKKLIIK